MADKKYVSIFVPPNVRDSIKKKAEENGRTIIGELSKKYKVPKGKEDNLK